MENKKLNFNELFGIALSCLIEYDNGSIDDALDDMRIRDREIRQEIKDWYGWEKEDQSIQDEDCDEDEDVYESHEVLKPSMNLYAYLNEYSNGAWISFTFTIQGREYYCHGVGDCPCDPQLLKMYEVTEETCLYVSQSQGSAYVLKVRKIDEK